MTHKLFNAISFRIAIIFSLSTVIILLIMGLVFINLLCIILKLRTGPN
jgi:two-component system heavy metal sensor histidine kinase CusS